jgi:hypothetical protein
VEREEQDGAHVFVVLARGRLLVFIVLSDWRRSGVDPRWPAAAEPRRGPTRDGSTASAALREAGAAEATAEAAAAEATAECRRIDDDELLHGGKQRWQEVGRSKAGVGGGARLRGGRIQRELQRRPEELRQIDGDGTAHAATQSLLPSGSRRG